MCARASFAGAADFQFESGYHVRVPVLFYGSDNSSFAEFRGIKNSSFTIFTHMKKKYAANYYSKCDIFLVCPLN